MNVTFDTNVLISATQWNNSVSHKLLLLLVEKEISIFTTESILEEFSEVLCRSFRYSKEEATELVEILLGFLHVIQPVVSLQVVIRDPDDDKILECAVSSHSEFIVTYDKDLLDFKNFQGIKILKPDEFLRLLS
ncbi:putative toxin-antitoxin system toxin component, PIN family [Candidatus Nomurabacteria bacterium RIFCSPHIGHO2_01_FULL_39_10]|uniref:Putative toxin-antitoxin system toxin component, PIN family n=1 Tax=Candidatus Nomurabacteria bacterium RIFCSPHIGHO2_01_FULL_39_10 TaxID=1801733 RepID=A0A1F6V908_9BACT|nr:MAG: putative toxin-antitoxin system toxin component, PIN family [Candidatus Nomurabacteria bacterium RIFCSPHIGHO2_01_FULL_39_10]